MKKLLITLLGVLAIGYLAKAQSSEFKPSGNLWGYAFGDYYYMAHADSLGRGAGNLQYKPYSTTSTLNAISGVTSTTTANAAGDITKVTIATTKSNLLGSGTNNFTKANAFQLRRVYLGYDYHFAPKLTAYLVLADEQDIDNSGYNTVYLKYANVKWTNFLSGFIPNQDLTIGQQVTTSFAVTPFGTEPLWSYRSIERTILDIHNIDASTDLGISLDGLLWKGMSGDSLRPNILGYGVQVGNGNSAKPENDGFKKFRYTLYTSLIQQKLTIGYYGDFYTLSLSPVTSMVRTYKGYANYKGKKFKIGTEIFTEDIGKSAKLSTGAFRDVQIFGWSGFCSGKILENLNFFARLDVFNPDIRYHNSDTYSSVPSLITPSYVQVQTVTSSALATYSLGATPISQATVFSRQTFYTLGLDWTVDKRFHIMPNIWVTDFKSLVNVPSGATHAAADNDVVPRVTFYYLFNGSKKVNNNGMDN